ncbi:hypothetical protein GCM10011531_06090 [Aquaticitalea lipolytica]|jgi:hypothetical protein|uniref:Uncharacterized protein n=1 Tax=Aquaticitalea lipolytica TaxID=1247562 RepID=A0A8J2XEP3_9FLAO|nr:hypothetical protein [Aquaticitalea lipolytica]GFZ79230.1 hypothetical protein GCM10011531_06090 [Aquaticitalea lipolytica]
MNDALIILSIIGLLFSAMYVYSYSSEYLAERKLRAIEKRQLQKEAQINEQHALKEKIISEKYEKLQQRSNEIKAEFERLSQFRQNVFQKHSLKNKNNNVNIA